jgi:hypothetical protein
MRANRSSHGAKLAEAKQILMDGGIMRFVWGSNQPAHLAKASGELRILDGRTYESLRKREDLIRTETGSTETRDLIIEWKCPLILLTYGGKR